MGYLQGQYARRHSPRPNPFYQEMFPPAPPTDDTKVEQVGKKEEGPSAAVSETPETPFPTDPTTETKPTEPSHDSTSDPETKPSPEDPDSTETKLPIEPASATEPSPLPVPEPPPMRQWSDLSQSEQLDVLWTLCEWQFQGAMRLRNLLGEEDSGVGWRMEPVGWDSKKNTYWLVGETRLWIQHHIPLPKLPPKKKSRMAQVITVPLEPTISSRAPPSFESDSDEEVPAREPEPELEPTPDADSESELSDAPPPPSKPARQTRKRSAEESTDSARKRVRRVSLRTKGSAKQKEEEEEPVAEKQNGAAKLEDPFGSDSDLTEVDELERELEESRKKREGGRKKRGRAASVKKAKPKPKIKLKLKTPEVEEKEDEKEKQLPTKLHVAPLVDPMLPPPLPPGFIEWETVCATLQDWEAFPKRFEKATHPNEKSFRTFLNNVLVPAVSTSLRAQLKVKKLETAVQNRKRSSRLAIKESILESQRQEEAKRAEEMELHARARRVEERERRAHEEALRRERDRETKTSSRETRASGRRGLWDVESTSGSASPAPDFATPDPPVKIRLRTGMRSLGTSSPVSASGGSGTTSRTDDPWELLCEGCGKQGWNIDDGSQLVKCESCGRWSHTTCHDRADELAGNPKRNWSSVDFTCRACSNTARKPSDALPTPKTNEVAPTLKSNELVPRTTGTIIPPTNGSQGYMYTSFQALPNGHVPTQPSAYPQAVYTPNGVLQVGYPGSVLPQAAYNPNAVPQPTHGPNGAPQTGYGANVAPRVPYAAGNVPPQPVYPNVIPQTTYGVNGVPQATYTVPPPHGTQPSSFAPSVQRQSAPSPTPAPIPQYQTPVPPVSQPPYPYPYPNGYPGS
ncbi:ATP-dependent RNA helicase DDX5/DBP2 [Ceratobasidium sp. AG-Ba]|nr:ATP-dependent RNA helicase DDX5/DBP2 [Ceratobasidium sp. AG-Ba]